MTRTYDIAVIGGGVVGCATLSELTNYGYTCVLLEKNGELLEEASSGNSGMLHTGFDAYEDGHELDCIRYTQGRVFPILEKLGVPVNKIGATMVAWTDQQEEQLPLIYDRCRRQNLTDISVLSPSEVHQREHYIRGQCKGGLWIPGETVIDSWLFPILLANDARKKGAEVKLNSRVQSCVHDDGPLGGWSLATTSGLIQAKTVVNCAGLYGDLVDHMAGLKHFEIRPRKGQYLVYDTPTSRLVNSNILPVPTALGKGVIIFRSVYDNLVVGPTAENVPTRTRAPIDDAITKRLYDVTKHVVPALSNHSVVTMYTGVRPATGIKDYVIKPDVERNWITVGGIRSTGVSGCLGIAAKVRELVVNKLCKEPTRGRSVVVSRPEVRFTNNGGCVMVDGHRHVITHPLSYLGLKKMAPKL